MILCSTDWHGNLELAKKILNSLQPEDTLYYLGDAIDRGESGWTVLKMLLDNPQVVFIKGNHEQMLEDCYNSNNPDYKYLWFSNGGAPTDVEMSKENTKEIRRIMNILKALPLRVDLMIKDRHIILTHAGMTPSFAEMGYPEDYIKQCYLWDRKHLRHQKWNKKYPNTYIIHGHTPCQLLSKYIELSDKNNLSYTSYCEGHKIDLDVGTVQTNSAVLFNLTTFKGKVISVE